MSDDVRPTRERLLAAAIVQMREVGARQFSLRSTARAAGVDPAMVYRHFADKDALIEAVALHGFGRLAERSEAAIREAGDEPGARLQALGRTYLHFAVDHPTEFDVMFRVGRRALPSGAPTAFDQLGGLLRELDEQNGLSIPVDAAALLCWSTVHGLATLVVDGGLVGYGEADPDVLFDVVVGNLLRFLGA